jgi:hypothetical protein
MKRISLFLLVLQVLFCANASAQFRDIPPEVTTAFTKQYPGAEAVTYKDNLKNFYVAFTMNGEKTLAKYSTKGEWKESEKITVISKLPKAVIEGFEKSKYADWKVSEATVISMPRNIENYRVKVEKGDLQKKNLFFNKEGRLTKDGLTL